MPVCIRLSRYGMNKQPYYRIVVADSRKPRDGRFVEIIGAFNPRSKDQKVTLNKERFEYWVKNGARPTQTVSEIVENL